MTTPVLDSTYTSSIAVDQLIASISGEVVSWPIGAPTGHLWAYLAKLGIGAYPWGKHLWIAAYAMSAHGRDSEMTAGYLSPIHTGLTRLFEALSLRSMQEWAPEVHLLAYLHSDVLVEDSQQMRLRFWRAYRIAATESLGFVQALPLAFQQSLGSILFPQAPITRATKQILHSRIMPMRGEHNKRAAQTADEHLQRAWSRFYGFSRLCEQIQSELVRATGSRLPMVIDKDSKGSRSLLLWDQQRFVMRHSQNYGVHTLQRLAQGGHKLVDPSTAFLEIERYDHLDSLQSDDLWFLELLDRNVVGESARHGARSILRQRQSWLVASGYEGSLNRPAAPFDTGIPGVLRNQNRTAFSRFLREARQWAQGTLVQWEPLYRGALFGMAVLDLCITYGFPLDRVQDLEFGSLVRLSMKADAPEHTGVGYALRFRGAPPDKPAYLLRRETVHLIAAIARLPFAYAQEDNLANNAPARIETEGYCCLFAYQGTRLREPALRACLRFLLHTETAAQSEHPPGIQTDLFLSHLFHRLRLHAEAFTSIHTGRLIADLQTVFASDDRALFQIDADDDQILRAYVSTLFEGNVLVYLPLSEYGDV